MDLGVGMGLVDEWADFIDEMVGASRKKWGSLGENENSLKFFGKIVLHFGALSV